MAEKKDNGLLCILANAQKPGENQKPFEEVSKVPYSQWVAKCEICGFKHDIHAHECPESRNCWGPTYTLDSNNKRLKCIGYLQYVKVIK